MNAVTRFIEKHPLRFIGLGLLAYVVAATASGHHLNPTASNQNPVAATAIKPVPAEEAPNEIKRSDYAGYFAFAEKEVKDELRDPDSVKLSNVTVYKSGGKLSGVCGEVNAKNGFGGYAGKQVFVITSDNNVLIGDLAARMYVDTCHGERQATLPDLDW